MFTTIHNWTTKRKKKNFVAIYVFCYWISFNQVYCFFFLFSLYFQVSGTFLPFTTESTSDSIFKLMDIVTWEKYFAYFVWNFSSFGCLAHFLYNTFYLVLYIMNKTIHEIIISNQWETKSKRDRKYNSFLWILFWNALCGINISAQSGFLVVSISNRILKHVAISDSIYYKDLKFSLHISLSLSLYIYIIFVLFIILYDILLLLLLIL